MKTKLPRTRRRISFGSAAILLVVSALVAQMLGFLRTKLVNSNFNTPFTPPDQNAGVYFAAFQIPDFFFFTIAAGALGVAFMPYLADRLNKGDRKGMWELSTSLLNLLSIIMLAVGAIIFIFAKPLIHYVVAPGLTEGQLENAANLMRFLALNPFLFTISGILTSTQQTMGRFFFYAIAPIFYNVAIIASIYIFKDNIGIVGMGIGALAGAVLQLAVVAFGTIGLGFHWRPYILWKSGDFRSMLRQLPPRSLDQGIDQLQSIVETNFASNRLLGGATAISNYNNAYILQTAPVMLIGTAISTAIFPKLNNRLSQGRPDLFRADFVRTLRLIIWITMPVVVVGFFARGYLARLIFSNNAPQIAIIFGFLCVAIFFRTVYTLISRWFYAQKDSRTPLLVSLFTISLNLVLAYILSRPSSYGVAGLALAQSIVAAVEVFILGAIMLVRDPKLFDKEFWSGIFRIVSVTGFSLVAGYITVSFVPLGVSDRGFITLGAKFCAIAGVTLATHLALSGLFGLAEARPFWNWVKRVTLRPVKVDYS